MWMSHHNFPKVVNEAWEGRDLNLPVAVDEFTIKAKVWNKKIFGNVFANKRLTLAQILGIQRAIANHLNPFLLKLQAQLSDEFNQILQWEEDIWAIKARSNWIVHGERKTSFFHLTTLIRRSFNKITCIENEYGILTHDMEEVKSLFLNGFKSLYQIEMASSSISNQINSGCCDQITQVDVETLSLPPFDLEISNALFAM